MNNHYIPQYYLNGFTVPDSAKIYIYDKKDTRIFAAPIKRIANSCDLYTPELENYLNKDIELPAREVIKKILNSEILAQSDKDDLSKYIAVMWKRVPRGKQRVGEKLPGIAEDLRKKYQRDLEEHAISNPHKIDFCQSRKAELDGIINKISENPPVEIWHRNIRADSITLFATRGGGLKEGYYPAKDKFIREMNRRTASNTTRYAFFCQEEKWILPFLKKKNWQLHYITYPLH